MPARALGVLSRVLAAHPGDPEALALLERAQLGADEASTLDDVDPAHDAQDDDVLPLAAGATQMASRAEPGTQRAMLFVGMAVLLIAVAGVSRFVDQTGEKSAPVITPPPPPQVTESGMSLSVPERVEPNAPEGEKAVSPRIAVPTRIASEARAPLVHGGATAATPSLRKPPSARATSPTQAAAETAPVVEGTPLRRVDVRVYPPAKVQIDGSESIDVFREASLDLSPGRHTLRFTNPAAVAADRVVDVPRDGVIAPIIVQLEPAPALVEVNTKGVDATVAIRPTNGSTGDKIIPAPHDGRRPVPVFFEKDLNGRFIGVLEYEVTATAPGKRPLTKIVKLEAGKTLRLSLVLEDALNAQRDDATSPPATP